MQPNNFTVMLLVVHFFSLVLHTPPLVCGEAAGVQDKEKKNVYRGVQDSGGCTTTVSTVVLAH